MIIDSRVCFIIIVILFRLHVLAFNETIICIELWLYLPKQCVHVDMSITSLYMYMYVQMQCTIVISLLVSVMVHVAVLLSVLVAIGSMKKALTARNPFETEVC